MKKARLSWIALPLLLLFQNHLTAQSFECTNCPIDFMVAANNGLVIDEIEVPAIGTDDLGATPLVSVCFDITHSWVGDLFIVLESPAGKPYFLMGDENNNQGGCGSSASNVNVCFNTGTDAPLTVGASYDVYCGTDPGICLSGDWTVGCGPSMESDLLPFALEAPNCDLDDFNAPGDPVGGVWRAYFGCVCGAGEGAVLNNWSLEFQGSTALLPCPGPATTTASIAAQPCEGDNLVLSATGGNSVSWEGPNGFTSEQPASLISNFSDAVAGTYTCTIVTEAQCFDTHEVIVENVCQKQDVTIQKDLTQEICFSEITSAERCAGGTSSVLEMEMNGNCITLTGIGTGVDSVCIWENLGGEEIFHRLIVDIPQPIYTYPGDLNSDGKVNHLDPLYLGLAFGQTGYARSDASTDWTAQYAPDWETTTPLTQVNMKHADANGNGIVDLPDLALTAWSWGNQHNDAENVGINFAPAEPGTAAALRIEAGTLEMGASYELPIFLGSSDLPAANVNGLAFRIIIDDVILSLEEVGLNLQGELFGELNEGWTYLVRHEADGIYAAITRLGNSPISGHGQIGTLNFTMPDNLPADSEITFEIVPDLCLDGSELTCAIAPGETTSGIVSGTAEAFPSEWSLAPNPTNGQVVLQTAQITPTSIDVIDIQGVVKKSVRAETGQTRFDIGHLANGLYFVRVATEEQVYFQRVSLVD